VKELQLSSAQQMFGPENPIIKQQEAEISGLRKQLDEARAATDTGS
jgi:capsule polysaccharide export protein KpsE/RkpR